MTAPAPLSSYKSSTGIAKEATKGTAAGAMTDWIALKERPELVVQEKYLMDESNRGSLVDNTGAVAGVTWSEYSMKGDVMADTIGYPLAGVLGEVLTTNGSAPFSHTITLLNTGTGQAPSYTLLDNYGGTGTLSRTVAAFTFEELGFSFTADGLLEYTSKGQGFASATTNNSVPSFTTQPPLAGWIGAASVAGTSTTILLGADFTFKREVERGYTAQNQQGPAFIWDGKVGVTGTLNFVMEGDAELNRFLNNTQPALLLDFTQGASAALVEVKFSFTKCAYTGAPKIDRSGVFPKISVPFTAVGNSTDVGASGGYGPCKVTLQNAKAASTFA